MEGGLDYFPSPSGNIDFGNAMKTQTQKERILQLLQDNPAGINSFGVARELALQLPTRIFELKKSHNIISTPKSDGSVDYVLMDAPVKKITRYEFQGSRAIPIYE